MLWSQNRSWGSFYIEYSDIKWPNPNQLTCTRLLGHSGHPFGGPGLTACSDEAWFTAAGVALDTVVFVVVSEAFATV